MPIPIWDRSRDGFSLSETAQNQQFVGPLCVSNYVSTEEIFEIISGKYDYSLCSLQQNSSAAPNAWDADNILWKIQNKN